MEELLFLWCSIVLKVCIRVQVERLNRLDLWVTNMQTSNRDLTQIQTFEYQHLTKKKRICIQIQTLIMDLLMWNRVFPRDEKLSLGFPMKEDRVFFYLEYISILIFFPKIFPNSSKEWSSNIFSLNIICTQIFKCASTALIPKIDQFSNSYLLGIWKTCKILSKKREKFTSLILFNEKNIFIASFYSFSVKPINRLVLHLLPIVKTRRPCRLRQIVFWAH